MTEYKFNIYKEQGNNNEYFIDKHTGNRVYTYINGQKQNINYAKHGITRAEFETFINNQNNQQPIQQIRNQRNNNINDNKHVTFNDEPTIINKRDNNDKNETFLSSGVYGANYNDKDRSLTGQALFSDMMLENGNSWRTITDRVNKTGRANDGANILGAGPGNEFDDAMKAHIRNAELFDGLSTEYQTPEKLKEINKNINQDMGSTPTNSIYNRGYQTKAKIVDIGDRAVCAMPEKYMPERDRNRKIYKVHQVIGYPGYDVNIERIGQDVNAGFQSAHTQRTHGRRINIPSKSKDSLLASQFGGVVPKQFGATIGRT